MTGEEFVQEMNATIWQLLSVRDAALAGLKERANLAEMPDLLRCALRHELEATEIAALWVASTAETEVKLTFARQAGDEARHYMLVAGRLAELGGALGGPSPTGAGRSKLFRYLEGLDSTVERVAAGLFAREAGATSRTSSSSSSAKARATTPRPISSGSTSSPTRGGTMSGGGSCWRASRWTSRGRGPPARRS